METTQEYKSKENHQNKLNINFLKTVLKDTEKNDKLQILQILPKIKNLITIYGELLEIKELERNTNNKKNFLKIFNFQKQPKEQNLIKKIIFNILKKNKVNFSELERKIEILETSEYYNNKINIKTNKDFYNHNKQLKNNILLEKLMVDKINFEILKHIYTNKNILLQKEFLPILDIYLQNNLHTKDKKTDINILETLNKTKDFPQYTEIFNWDLSLLRHGKINKKFKGISPYLIKKLNKDNKIKNKIDYNPNVFRNCDLKNLNTEKINLENKKFINCKNIPWNILIHLDKNLTYQKKVNNLYTIEFKEIKEACDNNDLIDLSNITDDPDIIENLHGIEKLKINLKTPNKFKKNQKEKIFSINTIDHIQSLKELEINNFAFQDSFSPEDKIRFINILIEMTNVYKHTIQSNQSDKYAMKIKYFQTIKTQLENKYPELKNINKNKYIPRDTLGIEQKVKVGIKEHIINKNKNFLIERNTILLEEVNQMIYSHFQEVRENSFKKLKNLESLTLTNGNLQSLIGFENLKKVRKLNLSNNKLVSLENLKNLPELEELDISHNYLDDNLDNKSVYEILKTLPKLKKLTISAKKDDFANIILNGEDGLIHTKNTINLNNSKKELKEKIQTMLPNCQVECKNSYKNKN